MIPLDELERVPGPRGGGSDCAELPRSAIENVRRPRVRVLSIDVQGKRGQARVRTPSASERAIEETTALECERGRFCIASLSR